MGSSLVVRSTTWLLTEHRIGSSSRVCPMPSVHEKRVSKFLVPQSLLAGFPMGTARLSTSLSLTTMNSSEEFKRPHIERESSTSRRNPWPNSSVRPTRSAKPSISLRSKPYPRSSGGASREHAVFHATRKPVASWLRITGPEWTRRCRTSISATQFSW